MKKQWWHDKVAYQIYPKSFCDTNGDGIGDIQGILSKLDYLKNLGIDILWLSPMYASPFVDEGYDISDYYNIAPEFGTMKDFDRLLAETKKRGMHLIMDLVINHCSDKHEWFQKALAQPDGEYADRFYFVKGKDGNPPSNYRSYFGGSVWEPVPGTDKYYLHTFAKEQPDLNWENPVVREKIYKMVNWWLDKGLAGFRIDAITNIKKDLAFPSFSPDGADGLAAVSRMVDEVDGVGDMLEDLKTHTFAKHDSFTVAEVFNMKEKERREFVGEEGHFSTMFDFTAECLAGQRQWLDTTPVDLLTLRNAIFDSQLKCQDICFLANIIENHDEPRGASRFLPDYAQNETGVKMLATINLYLRGIPFIYQGQEIGMRNCPMNSIQEYDDIDTKNQYAEALKEGASETDAINACHSKSRDNARTPMQWDSSTNAGFTSGKPWLKVNPNYRQINVAEQASRADSVLHYYQKLIALHKSEQWQDLFTEGGFEPAYLEQPTVFAYCRFLGEKRVLIAANFGSSAVTLSLAQGEILVKNHPDIQIKNGKLYLPSCGAAVFSIPPKEA